MYIAGYFCFYGVNSMQQNDSSCQDQREDRQPKINTEIAADLVKNLQNVDTDLFFELMSENYSAG